jgi:tRNA/tmRNA/rRNA uracil-C5-methylase (TrmA/RlmC/RlmD family)
MQLHVDMSGDAGPYKERSHEVVQVKKLPLAVEDINDLGLHTRNWQDVSKIEIATSSSGQIQWKIDKKLKGDARLIERAAGRTFRITGGGFWQVHKGAANLLTDVVTQMVAEVGLDLNAPNLDLYGGVGLFAGALASKFANRVKVTTVENSKQATEDAKLNLADLPAVRAVFAPVERFIVEQVTDAKNGVIDYSQATVVLDPPRSGAGAKVIGSIVKLAPKHIVYVACDPVSLARDLKQLLEAGYQIKKLRAFDLFPHTHHFETIVSLVPKA